MALTIGVASALSFSWGTKTKISFNGTQLTTAALAAPATVELIYLGKDNAWSFDEKGLVSLTRVCGVAGLGGKPYRDGSFEYYINEVIRDNDPKGVAPFIMLCIEMND